VTSTTLDRQLAAITGLVQLEKRVRHTRDAQEFGFLAVNETKSLVLYRQAALWRAEAGRGSVLAVSGLALPEADAPYVTWLTRACRRLAEADAGNAPRPVAARDLPESEAREWADWLPVHGLWLPLADPAGHRLGALLLARDAAWSEAERHLLAYVADAYGHAWALLQARRSSRGAWRTRRGNRLTLGLLAVAIAAGAVPMRQSALAPAEVVARAPSVVRAPFDGVVDHVAVEPNQPVEAGQLLLALDPTRLRHRLEVARKAREVADAELRQASQQAVVDVRSKTALPVLQGQLEQHTAEVDYLESLLKRIEIRAPRAGIAIFDDVNDWIGKPLTTGERILMVAAPEDTELELHLPVAEAFALGRDAEIALFLNADPHHPVAARLTWASYRPVTTPEGILAYRLKARFAEGQSPVRIGMKGTARVYGDTSFLAYAALRRPLSAVRQWLGL